MISQETLQVLISLVFAVMAAIIIILLLGRGLLRPWQIAAIAAVILAFVGVIVGFARWMERRQ